MTAATQPQPFLPGDLVECLDASNGAHFLRAGYRFVVQTTQVDDRGMPRVCLVGMAAAWEANRFRLVHKG